MTAQIIQLRDYQNPKDLERLYSETALEAMAIELMAAVLSGEPSIYIDTAPSEMNPDKSA